MFFPGNRKRFGTVIAVALIAGFGAGCETPQKKAPPPDYMAAMDRIAVSFKSYSEDLTGIGSEMEALERKRFQLDPDADKEFSDEQLEGAIRNLRGRLSGVRGKIVDTARTFDTLTNVPGTEDKNGQKIYKEHNKAMKNLLIALLGKDKDGDIVTSRPDYKVEITTKESTEPRLFGMRELRDKEIIFVYNGAEAKRRGYFEVMDEYLRLNLLKLKGRQKVTLCEMWRSSKEKYNCSARNVHLISILGGGKAQNRFGSERKASLWSGPVRENASRSLWLRVYKDKEGEVVKAMRQVIKTRKRISVFLQAGA